MSKTPTFFFNKNDPSVLFSSTNELDVSLQITVKKIDNPKFIGKYLPQSVISHLTKNPSLELGLKKIISWDFAKHISTTIIQSYNE